MKLFVTGTDTGVGKTFVTTALARAFVAAGKSILVSTSTNEIELLSRATEAAIEECFT